MNRTEIRISGFGGQGVVLSGIILGRAAAVYEDIYSCQSQSYGPEARGGAARSDVVISDKEIDYPMVMSADVLVTFSQESLDTHLPTLKDNGTLIVDSGLVKELPDEKGKAIFQIEATELAEEKLSSKLYANTIMLGYFAQTTEIISPDSIRRAVADLVPPKTVERNLKAFDLGSKL